MLRTTRRLTHPKRLLLACVALAAFCGCGQEPVRFHLNFEGKDRHAIDESTGEPVYPFEKQRTIVTALDAMFGTPDEPFAWPESGLDLVKLNMAAGPSYGAEGKQAGLFRVHCAHCHGVTGGGDGPTARFLNPYPRDYRKGLFKFTSTGPGSKPTLGDLKRTLRHGINGTAMPSFLLLPDDEIDALAEYVKYLAIRGEVEELLQSQVFIDEEDVTRDLLTSDLEAVSGAWNAAEQDVVIPPEPKPQVSQVELLVSIEKGRKLFHDSQRTQCVKCHGPVGLGDGGEKLYDDWNKPKVAPGANPDLWTLPPQVLKPRNLRLGIYRGGRRPLDLYRRIYSGIKGAQMPAFRKTSEADKKGLSSEEIWNLVDFVRSLPYTDQAETLSELAAKRERP